MYIAPYAICKKIALRRFTYNIQCKTVLHEQSIYTSLYKKYLYDVFMTMDGGTFLINAVIQKKTIGDSGLYIFNVFVCICVCVCACCVYVCLK